MQYITYIDIFDDLLYTFMEFVVSFITYLLKKQYSAISKELDCAVYV